MKKRILLIILACVVLLSISIIPVAKAERGVTDTEIRTGQWGPLTGPGALWGAIGRGTGCFFDMINDEGGIHGRKIKYFLRDDGYMPPKTKAIVKELVEDKQVFAITGGAGTAPGMAVKKYLHSSRVPWVVPVSGSSHWAFPPTKYTFAALPLYCDEGAILANYAVKVLGKKRLAFVYQNDDFGKGELYGAEFALEKLGMKQVETVSTEITDTDLSSHVMRLKVANPDCVIMWVLPKQGAIMLGTAAKMDFKPQWLTSYVLGDTDIMYKISKGLFKDVIFTYPGELPDSQHPLVLKYDKARQKFAPNERPGPFLGAGFLVGELMSEGLKRCGRDLTVDNFVKAMESIKDFKGIGPKITFGPNQRQGARATFIAKCGEGGKTIRLTDWLTSDIDIQEVIKRLRK
jgi:ABC-type branched-subunit amino acid transport system substrate-binding protein